MPILLLDVVRAFRGLRRDAGFVVLGVLLFFALAGGGVAYWLLEDLGPLDALYLSVLTLTTVGYGDPAPVTAAGKLFTMGFVLVGLGILLAFVAMIAEHIRRHSVLRKRLERRGSSPEVDGGGEYDLLVVGSDAASRAAALEAARSGLRVVLVPAKADMRAA